MSVDRHLKPKEFICEAASRLALVYCGFVSFAGSRSLHPDWYNSSRAVQLSGVILAGCALLPSSPPDADIQLLSRGMSCSSLVNAIAARHKQDGRLNNACCDRLGFAFHLDAAQLLTSKP